MLELSWAVLPSSLFMVFLFLLRNFFSWKFLRLADRDPISTERSAYVGALWFGFLFKRVRY